MPESVLEAIRHGQWDYEPDEVDEEEYNCTAALPGSNEKITALAARAEEKIAAGELEQAIHLTDIVRSQQPEHADAVAASRKAHELLLEGSENFWLSSWLKHQIDTLNGIDIDKDTVDRRALTEG